LQRRFEDALKKLSADLEMKLAQRDEMKEQQRLKKEGVVPGDEMNEGDGDADGAGGDDDLFGEDEELESERMDVS
jgi:transcription initiation factor TFIID subunit 7